jgi:hypothetical protein
MPVYSERIAKYVTCLDASRNPLDPLGSGDVAQPNSVIRTYQNAQPKLLS